MTPHDIGMGRFEQTNGTGNLDGRTRDEGMGVYAINRVLTITA